MGSVRRTLFLHIILLLLVGGVLCVPQFAQDSYQTDCMENTILDTVLIELRATDSNGINNLLSYSIEDNLYFKINNTGFVKVKSPIDAEGPDVNKIMTYVVTATDTTNTALSGTTTLSVKIDDVNEYKPLWISPIFTARIYDGDLPGTPVVTISATDRDRDTNITYDFSPDFTDNFPYFKVNPLNGSVTINKTVNMADILPLQNNRNRFNIKPRAYDGKFIEFGAILITLLDKNHFAPEFVKPDIEISVNEGDTGVLLYTFEATDDKEEPTQKVRYRIRNQQIPGSLRIGYLTGEVTLVGTLDRETIPGGKIIQLVTAEDDGNPEPVLTSTATLTITVIDINDNIPQYGVPSYELRVPQTYKTGDGYSLPLATDADEGDNARVVYQLSPEAAQYFDINPDTSVLTTRNDCGQSCIRIVDCFLEEVKVYAFNPGTPSVNATLIVNITLTAPSSSGSTPSSTSNLVSCADANVPNDYDPTFPEKEYTVKIPESTPANVTVITVTATDDDFGISGDITYSIVYPDFGVTGNGEVFLKKIFDYEDPTQRDVCTQLIATDQGTPARSSSTSVCITITNVNDNEPQFLDPVYHAKLTDGDLVSTSVIRLTASDADGTSDLTYEIVPPVTYLAIEPTSGEITVTEQIIGSNILSGSTGDSVQITVRVNNGPFSAETTLNLTIESSNKFDPIFNQPVTNLTVLEESTGAIISLTATDGDVPKQTITYQLANPTFAAIFGVSASNGEVSVITAIDRENLPTVLGGGTFALEVLAFDDGFPVQKTGTSTLSIVIGDINDNVPQFTRTVYDLRVFESFAAGQQFQLPTATDNDVGQNAVILYNISSSADRFFVSKDNVLTAAVDCDEACVKARDCSLLQFSMWAYNSDRSEQKGELRVYVSLLRPGSTLPSSADPTALTDCSAVETPNDNAPKFIDPNYTANVNEGISVNTVVIKVNTTDDDFGESGKVVYTITNSTDFIINDQGEITTTRELNYEDPNDRLICMEVVATDKGTPARSASTVVCIKVLNENDLPPIFTQPIFSANVTDEARPGTFVTYISANDADAGSTITYDFIAPNDYFQLDPNTGNLTVLKIINRVDILRSFPTGTVTLQARASDGKYLVITQLRVTVLEINKFAPRFEKTVINTSVEEEVSGVDVIQVSAQDDDAVKQPITYTLINASVPVGVFTVDRVTGQIRLERSLDRETLVLDSVYLVVEARDIGKPPPQRSSSVTIRVRVNDINDNIPTFPQDFYNIQIFQNFTAGEAFLLPKAIDADFNATVRYELSDNAKEFLDIDSMTGTVTTRTNCEGNCVKLTDCHLMTFTVWSFNPSSPQLRDVLQVNITLLTLQGSRAAPDIPACSQASTPNDNAPKFIDPNYTANVNEGISVNTVVIKVNTTDDDFGESGKVVYTITNSTDFTINDQGEITTTRELNYEDPNDRLICMEVVATDKGTPARSASTVVCIKVLNENDLPPIFTQPIFSANVTDEARPGTFVTFISAKDADAGSTITYDFIAPNDYFQLDPNTGNVTVLKIINRADILRSFQTGVVTLQTRASDGKYLVITQLRITVLETNKFSPRFDDDVVFSSVDEEVSGVNVVQVTAKDGDLPAQPITYTLINSTAPAGVFSVNPSTGQIRLEQALDRESLATDNITLVVEAKDSGIPPPQMSTSVTIYVTVKDINDNVPNFPRDFYELAIFQNFTTGNTYPLPRATDADSSDVIQYELSDNIKQFLEIDSTTGVVTTRTNCEESCVKLTDCHYMAFTVWASNPGNPLQRDALQVNLTLLTLQGSRASTPDIPACSQASTPNDNAPKFIDPNYTANVNEGISVNTVVIKVNTTDDDFGESGKVVYTITNSTDFTINDQGEITTTRELNYEDPNDRLICMEVVATDKGTPARSASTIVCIKVLNENDQPPIFTQPIFSANVTDEARPGTFVTFISANDADAGSTITYDFIAPNDYFQLDPNTGNVTVLKIINRADILRSFPTGIVTLLTRASDGKYLVITQLRITVLETNKFSPRFDDDVVFSSVDEEVSGVNVVQVTAKDGDLPAQPITYTLINSTAPAGVFSVNPITGQIRLEQALDRESLATDNITLVVEAKDSGIPPPQMSTSVTIYVTVKDINDNVPNFPRDFYELAIFQNFTTGNTYPLPRATDADSSDVIQYELSDNIKQFLEIDSTTGVVTTRTNCEESCVKLTDCHYMTFTVWASNPGNPLQRDALQVNLTLLTLQGSRASTPDIPACSQASTPNDNAPKFIDPNYTANVNEGISVNTVVIKVNTTDDDFGESGKVVYTITNSTDFTINDQGEITTTRELNYEDPNDRLICMEVVATDKGTPARSASTVVCIKVLNENDLPPIFTQPIFSANVTDEARPGTFVTFISANDADAGSTITYDFIAPNDYFQLDPNTGNVTVLKIINRADILRSFPTGIVTLLTRASDGKYLVITQLRITVLETNKFSPRFDNDVVFSSVDEEVSGVNVVQVTAKDGDLPAQPITYTLINSTAPAGVFSVNTSTGQIRLEQALDRESLANDNITLVVEAKDSGIPPPQMSTSATIVVRINDINDNMPEFGQEFYELQIAQNFSTGDIFVLPKATDADVTSVIRYELSDNAKQFFNLDPTLGTLSTRTTCNLSCVKLVDCHYMTFTLSAFNPDNTALRDSLKVNLTLLTVQGTKGSATDIPACTDAPTPNNNDPKFDKPRYSVEVEEGVLPGSVIFKMNTTDSDFGDSGKVVYSITNSTDFEVNEDGEIKTRSDLDYENIPDPTICMEVVATDKGQPPRSASTVLCVTILNKNEHSPAFVSNTFYASVMDGDPANTFVSQITASDNDANAQLTYDFAVPNAYFQIDGASGNVTVSKIVERKDALGTSTTDFVSLQIRASDGQLSTTAELRVTIVEKNEFAPDFGEKLFDVSIQEENVINPVFTVTATDGDRVNEIITYSILNSTLPGVFSIGSQSGVITMNQAVDLEKLSQSYIDLIVVAADSGRPPPQLSSTATVRVTVNDINDNSPTFSVREYTAEIYQNFSSGDVVTIPTASDPDVNDVIRYSLDPSDPWFELDPDTGVLRIRQDCGDECVKIEDCYYGQLSINAFNAENPSTKATLLVKVNLLTTVTVGKITSPTGTLVPCSQARSPNNNDPKFDKPKYEVDLNENSPENEVVFVVTTTDGDFGNSGKVSYSITNSTDYGINDNGQIFVVNPPDYEDPNRRRDCFQVVATDSGTPPRQSSTVVCVNVLDLNDNGPVFDASDFQATAQDGDTPPKFIVQITATDADPGTKLIYSIVGGNPYFQIDPNSGNITVSRVLNRAQIEADTGRSLIPLTIQANDSQNIVTTRLQISISRKNEHAPKFTTERYDTGVEEESTKINMIKVQASDDDLPKRPVNYFIQSSNFSDHFTIDPVSGEISVVKTFDRESLSSDSVTIVVVAVDSGDPPPKLTSTAIVVVRIIDTNDHPPKFAENNFEIRLFQNFSSGISRQLPRATDADLGQNAAIAYELSPGIDNYFELNPSTALLTTINSCSRCERSDQYEWVVFTVTAFNRDRTSMTDQLQVTVILVPIGNGTIKEPIIGQVLEAQTVTVNIATAKVSDLVFDMKTMIKEGPYNYSMGADNNTMAYYQLQADGRVTLSVVPDISQKQYTMTLYALKGGSNPQNNTINLVVNIVDDTYLDEKGIAAISAICAIALLIIILAVVHIIWWKTRHKKDKEQVMEDEASTGCCCGKPIVTIRFPNGESSF